MARRYANVGIALCQCGNWYAPEVRRRRSVRVADGDLPAADRGAGALAAAQRSSGQQERTDSARRVRPSAKRLASSSCSASPMWEGDGESSSQGGQFTCGAAVDRCSRTGLRSSSSRSATSISAPIALSGRSKRSSIALRRLVTVRRLTPRVAAAEEALWPAEK